MDIPQMKKQMLRFFLVGCINSLVGFLVMFAAYYGLLLGYWMSSALNYLISSTCSYFLNRKYTFACTTRNWKLPFRFALNIIFCYFLAYSVAEPLTLHWLSHWPPAWMEFAAMVVGMVLFSVLNFFGQSWFVFPDEKKREALPSARLAQALAGRRIR